MKAFFNFWIVCLLFALGCSPSSLEDYQHEGEAVCRLLIKELKKIESREDLIKATPKLKKRFHQVVDIVIEARKFQEGHPEEKKEFTFDPRQMSDLLKSELKRIYQIEGGRELMEHAQREALIRLDAFEKEVKNHKQTLKPGKAIVK